MSAFYQALQMLPSWLRNWLQFRVVPALGLETPVMVGGLMRGAWDSILWLLLGTGLLWGSGFVLQDNYALAPHIQETVLKWAPVADQIAREADIPREVPLVLWFKENSMRAENPESCTGIIGAYDLVRSGSRPCFTPGPISDWEVREQLIIAAAEFKVRCPEITYRTQNPETIKRCYFAYNAGKGAAARLDADQSAYVMNNYGPEYRNMIYSDIELGTVRVTQLGAWPAHLAMQSLIVGQLNMEGRPFSIPFLDLSTHIYDLGHNGLNRLFGPQTHSEAAMALPARSGDTTCLYTEPIVGRNPFLQPALNPVADGPLLTQDLHGCSYHLPGLDISSSNRTALLQAPLTGEVTTYVDQWGNSTIRIENDEWIAWLLHARTYLVEDGRVQIGDAVGIMGAVGYATGPHVHYSLYNKEKESFVDPAGYLPRE
jgi:hypothetical protein